MMKLLLALLVVALASNSARGQGCEGGSCFPNTGDLLVGRGHRLSATSTCGTTRPEPYCIVSHLKDIQKCFTCDANVPEDSHAVQNVITTFNERLETWWQSANGLQQVSIQLDLEAEFQFTHAIMTFKTFRPAAMFIERSMDFGKTWNVYRYFAYDCGKSFPDISRGPPREIDDVICEERYSKIEPSNGGEVIFRVLQPKITIDDPYSPKIQNLLKITNFRINFTELHTLGDDLLDSRADIKNKYYYALFELIVRGNCFCYGHADECTPIDNVVDDTVSSVMVHGRCRCQHNTVGLNCEQCLPFYQDQPWRPAESGMPHECQPCNCNNHATECHFDAAVFAATGGVSGGVCEDCQHNTVGRQCEQCAPYFYVDPNKDIRDPYVCAPCECEVSGSMDGGICDGVTDPTLGMIAGQCRCKQNVMGPRCDQCKPGYFGLDGNNPNGCTACDCDSLGTLTGANSCDASSGQCICKRFTTGRRCDMCLPQTWGMSSSTHGCNECDCDIGGAYDNNCDESNGQCSCKPNLNHRRCDYTISGNFLPGLDFYIFEAEDAIIEKGAYEDKRQHTPPVTWTGDGYMFVQEEGVIVFVVSGLPTSMEYDLVLRYQSNMAEEWQYVDVTIDRPNQGRIPTSSPCGNTRPEDDHWVASLPAATTHHSLGIICLESDYTYRVIVDMRRYQREQDPNAPLPDILIDSLLVVPLYKSVDMFQGTIDGRQRAREFEELDCQNEEMAIPDREPSSECAGLLFSMSAIIHEGAQPCDCDPQGSESSICNSWGGQCVCKPNVIGRRCDRCAPGTYGFGPAGCRPCDCDTRGSVDQFCDSARGQCQCQPGVSGRQCNMCQPGHYSFPECPRCECNGHADTCDQLTGVCIGCRDNTVGEHCDSCEVGYYGNPLIGSLDQCKPCMCPNGPESSRQFASGCRQDQLTGVVTCYCLSGYTGPRCDECDSGYWGNPHQANGGCRECECNDNINPSDPGACDAGTGVCTGCLYDTAGPHCERCRDYFYGSAFENTCTACDCNILGTDRSYCDDNECQCDITTGNCQCLPNVTGRDCGQCIPNHWRLALGQGCIACDCNLANSKGPSCNEETGQCQCNEGFGGKTCTDCADGHFGNPHVECFACDCNEAGSKSSQCNPATGQCECLDGVGGRTCSRCLRGFTGEVPQCEPCGECFDNWDEIISDLEDRTSVALDKAKMIGETGITGVYEDEFADIEEALNQLKRNRTDPSADLQDLVSLIQNNVGTMEERIKNLTQEMGRIRQSDADINSGMSDIESQADALNAKLDELREQKQNISKVSPVAAYKQIQDAADQSEHAERKAQAATTEPGSLVNQSAEVRAAVEAGLDDNKMEFEDKLSMVEGDLADRKKQVDDLSVSQLNEDVCGEATEGCDESCGGAGCGTCGGIGCGGAAQFANDARTRAQKTQETLATVAEETGDLQALVQVTKTNAQEAKDAAQAAKDRSQEVEDKVRRQNKKVKDLIAQIREFLTQERASPKEIEILAEKVLELSLPIGREEIDALGADIRDLVSRLPDVDDILESTRGDLELAQQLLADANKAKADAGSVAGDANAVVVALEQAENASNAAQAAKDQAHNDITMAESQIEQIKTTTEDIEDKMNGISGRLSDFESRVNGVQLKLNDNILTLDDAASEANKAHATAQNAVDNLDGQAQLISDTTDAINDKKNKTERLTALRRNVQDLTRMVDASVATLDGIDSDFTDYETQLTEKSDALDALKQRAADLYRDVKEKEDYLRNC